MTEKHFIITLTENITVGKTSGTITRNSNSTQWLDVELDNWKLGEGEELYIELSHYDDDTELTTHVGPLHLFFNETLERYITLAPPEVICVSGTWHYSIEQRFNIGEDENEEITYNSLTSPIKSLTVVDTIISATQANSYAKETELLTAVKVLKENSENAATAAKITEDAAKRAESAAQVAEQSAQASVESAENAEQSAHAAKLSAATATEKALLSATNERQAAESAVEAVTHAFAAKQSAEKAEVAAQSAVEEVREEIKEFTERAETSAYHAENAQSAAEEARDKARDFANIAEAATSSGLRKVIIHSLPEEGSDNLIYLVPSGAATDDNYYDEYLWVADEETGKAKFEKIGTTRTDLMPYVKKTLLEETKEAIMAELANEVTEREDHDSILGTALTAETETREKADEEISAALSEEIVARSSVDENLDNVIALEIATRVEADVALREEMQEAVANVQVYDLVIRTQEEFEAFYATLNAGTCKAHSVLLVGDGGTLKFTKSNGTGLKLPETLYRLDGINNAIIEVTNFLFSSLNRAAVWYDELPTDNKHSISNLTVTCTGSKRSAGFYSCAQLSNCTGTGSSTGSGGYGFDSCAQLSNCIGTGSSTGSGGAGFYSCTQLSNCTGTSSSTGSGGAGYGFYGCTQLSNCTGTGNSYGFDSCTQLSNCIGSGDKSSFASCKYCSNCKSGKTAQTTIWSGTNIKRDDDSCEV